MDPASRPVGYFLRVIAVVSLLLGLNDAARLLGVTSGEVSPLSTLGATGFAYLAVFALTRLFAAVGLWIKASWGAVLLGGSTAIELALYLFGNPHVELSMIAFGVRLVVLVAILLLVAVGLRYRLVRAQD